MKKIGVQKGLKNVADFLSKEGYSVKMLGEFIEDDSSNLDNFDAIIAADYNINMMGNQTTTTVAPIINADGLNPEEIKSLIDKSIGK